MGTAVDSGQREGYSAYNVNIYWEIVESKVKHIGWDTVGWIFLGSELFFFDNNEFSSNFWLKTIWGKYKAEKDSPTIYDYGHQFLF